jgi:hypothetical protein
VHEVGLERRRGDEPREQQRDEPGVAILRALEQQPDEHDEEADRVQAQRPLRDHA